MQPCPQRPDGTHWWQPGPVIEETTTTVATGKAYGEPIVTTRIATKVLVVCTCGAISAAEVIP